MKSELFFLHYKPFIFTSHFCFFQFNIMKVSTICRIWGRCCTRLPEGSLEAPWGSDRPNVPNQGPVADVYKWCRDWLGQTLTGVDVGWGRQLLVYAWSFKDLLYHRHCEKGNQKSATLDFHYQSKLLWFYWPACQAYEWAWSNLACCNSFMVLLCSISFFVKLFSSIMDTIRSGVGMTDLFVQGWSLPMPIWMRLL